MKNEYAIIKPTIALIITAILVSTALVFTYHATKKDDDALPPEVITAVNNMLGENYLHIEIDLEKYKEINLRAIYKAKNSDREAFYLYEKGYGGEIYLVVCIENDKVADIDIIKNSETPGIGSRVSEESFLNSFNGITNIDDVDAISGATISSKAVKRCVQNAVNIYKELNDET